MIKEFLTLFSQLIDITQSVTVVDDDNETVRQTVELYQLLTEDEKIILFDTVKSFGEQSDAYRLYFEFLCLHYYKDRRYSDDILDCLLSLEIDVDRRQNYYAILGRDLFVAGLASDYDKRLKLERIIVDKIRAGAAEFPEYIPYDRRELGTVVFIIRPFLGEYHSPTLQTINMDNYLRKLGYRTFYISYCDNEILKKYKSDICAPFVRSVLFSGIGKFEYNCFGRKIEGLHFDLRADSMVEDLNALAVYISQINPEFVIGIEGGNILADLCTGFTDVITMNVVDDLPVTISDSVLRYFPGTYKNGYKRASEYNKTIFDAAYDNELMPYNDGGERIELASGRFHVCIMGNRLDNELDDKMLEVIRRLALQVPETDMVFIGKCPGTEEKLSDIKDRCRFLGYVERCEDAVGACSMFLNPPRTGGGGGGYMAIKRGIPVYTLKDCDVASCVGKEFEHNSFDELIPFVRKCIDDIEYYDSMCSVSEGNYRKRYHIDSIGNIKAFCDRYREHISHHN